MDEHNKAMAAAKSDEAKSNIVSSPLIKPMVFHIALLACDHCSFSIL